MQVVAGGGLVIARNDALAKFSACDGGMRLGVEKLCGASVEIKEVGCTIPGPGAELFGIECLTEAAGGLALEGAGGVEESDFGNCGWGDGRVASR